MLKTDQNTVRHSGIILWLFVASLFCLGLSACGWHLRGAMTENVTLPPMQLQFQQASPDLKRELRQMLTASGVEINTEAELILIIQRESQGRRVLSVGSNGRVNEYELQYEIEFSLRQVNGEALISNERISQQRDYQFDEAAVLAKREEERRLFDFMRSMSIQSLLRQLHSVTANETEAPVSVDAD